MGGDTRISTPTIGSTGEIRHNVIKRRGLRIRVHRLSYQRYTKSRGHYRRSNDIYSIPYPTHHILSVGIIKVDREIWIELFYQGSWMKMIYIQKRQPTPMLKVPLNLPIKLIKNHLTFSLNKPKYVKLLIGLLVFLKSKPITLESWGRGGRGFLVGSSFPNHDAKGWKGKTNTETKERKQRKPKVDCLERVRKKT